MNRRATQLDLHRYDTLWTLSKILRFIGWGVMLLGLGAAAVYLVIALPTISTFMGYRGGVILLIPLLLSAGFILGSAVALGVIYLAFSELLKVLIDIAFFGMNTSQVVTRLAEDKPQPVDMSGVKDELAQMTAVLREVNTHTQQTASLLEQVTRPRAAAK